MNIISIDPSVQITGIYINHRKYGGKSLSIKPKGKTKLIQFFTEFNKIISDNDIKFAFIEDYAYGAAGKGFHLIAEYVGIIKYCLQLYNVIVIKVNVSTWKSYMSKDLPKKGTSNSDKQKYLNAIQKKFGHLFTTTDEADAWMIYGAMYLISRGGIKSKTAKKLYKIIKDFKIFDK